jgi:hypothetical protein
MRPPSSALDPAGKTHQCVALPTRFMQVPCAINQDRRAESIWLLSACRRIQQQRLRVHVCLNVAFCGKLRKCMDRPRPLCRVVWLEFGDEPTCRRSGSLLQRWIASGQPPQCMQTDQFALSPDFNRPRMQLAKEGPLALVPYGSIQFSVMHTRPQRQPGLFAARRSVHAQPACIQCKRMCQEPRVHATPMPGPIAKAGQFAGVHMHIPCRMQQSSFPQFHGVSVRHKFPP